MCVLGRGGDTLYSQVFWGVPLYRKILLLPWLTLRKSVKSVYLVFYMHYYTEKVMENVCTIPEKSYKRIPRLKPSMLWYCVHLLKMPFLMSQNLQTLWRENYQR